MSIEFHCHTLFSIDGSGTPEALVDAAAERGVTALAVTEHNHLGSAARAAARAAALGIRYFPGVELNAFFNDRCYDFLGLGVDPDNAALRAVAARNHDCYAYRFELYFEELRRLGYPWGREELEAHLAVRYPTHPAPVLSSYVIAHYAEQQGGLPGFPEMKQEAMRRIADRDRYSQPGPPAPGRFGRFEEARDAVHAAGGVFLVAHVANQAPEGTAEQTGVIRAMVDAGADGFELYHPAHVLRADLGALAAFAREIGCLVSGGSDCHHAPGTPPKEIGSCGAPEEFADRLAAALMRRAGRQPGTGGEG
jgi:predicted metal-dependent phosphoesterase TrpH